MESRAEPGPPEGTWDPDGAYCPRSLPCRGLCTALAGLPGYGALDSLCQQGGQPRARVSASRHLSAALGMEGSKTSSSTMQVSFVCQRCSQPLKLDTSFKILDRVTIQELTGQRDSCLERGCPHPGQAAASWKGGREGVALFFVVEHTLHVSDELGKVMASFWRPPPPFLPSGSKKEPDLLRDFSSPRKIIRFL